jgi:hypothetical protein
MNPIVEGSRVFRARRARWLLIGLTGLLMACGGDGAPPDPPAADLEAGDVALEVSIDSASDSMPMDGAEVVGLADGESDGDADIAPDAPDDATSDSDAPGGDLDAGPDAALDTDAAPDAAPVDVPGDLGVDQLPADAQASGGISVLFIGNSYTFGNGLPGMVEDWAVALGLDLTTEMIAKGGAILEDHGMDPTTLAVIADTAPTYVVLQGQSLVPFIAPFSFYSGAVMLAEAAHAAGSIPVFFETWARVAGHELYDGQLSGHDPTSMQAVLRDVYKTATLNNNGVYAPVGDAWETSLTEHPDLTLHGSDGSHAALTGSYLAAAVFVSLLGDVQVGASAGVWAPEGMDESNAKVLRQMAHDTLLEQ